ncbi:MAG TPA: DUF6603 domain-containing protein, partial [Pseudonocardiaceae bacterium]|nr:DUF6603 domain-containing protein [Pseudonocardiaceae bacterium]
TASLDASPPKAWITPKAGEYWLAAGIEFTSFELVSTKAMLVVEFGDDLTIALLGLSTLRLPQQVESPETYAYVEMMIRVVVQPEQGVFEATAILSPNSYVITPDGHLTGGFAFSLWFGASPHAGQFVATLGGYHPAFRPPDYYPVVPRLGFNWAISDVVTMKGEAYFALTPSCVMAGGALDVLFSDGGLRAWCTAHADFLVAWRPFHYQASIAVSIGVSYQLNVLGCTKTLSASLGADLELVGPPTSGTARVNYVVISFTIRFGTHDGSSANTKPLGWTDFATLLPGADVLCRITAGDGLYRTQPSADSSGSRWIVRAQRFTFQTSSAIPASQVVYGDHATAVTEPPAAGIAVRPMNLTDVASTHTLKIYRGTESTPVDPTGWTMTPVRRPVPDALWGPPPAPFTQLPARPSADTVPDQITGLSVTAPVPAIGASRGPVVAQVLAEEYLSPSGRAPVVAGTAPVTRYLPVFDDTTVGLVEQIAGPDAAGSRAALFAALHGAGVLDGTDGALTGLAAGAAHLFSDPPMRQD